MRRTTHALSVAKDDLGGGILRVELKGATGGAGARVRVPRGWPPPPAPPLPGPPLPAPPTPSESPNRGGLGRVWAIVGVVSGFLFFVIPGFIAIRSYSRWRAGSIRRPTFAWICGCFGLACFGAYAWWVATIPHQLIDADFRVGHEPFPTGQYARGAAARVGGTYEMTVNDAGSPFMVVGRFVRVAYNAGIRAEIEGLSAPETVVGTLCLGPADGSRALVGYGFIVEPGGSYLFGRLGPDGDLDDLDEGKDTRVRTVQRVSITCVPALVGARVTVTGYANGLRIGQVSDSNGYRRYTYAGLIVGSRQVGAQVRFTRVSARIVDDEWVP